MINLEELLIKQEQFDKDHCNKFEWNERITDDNIAILEHLMLAMVGEFGEAANIVKKIVRGDMTLYEAKEELSEEIGDMFIYLLKLIYQLDIDIEKVYDKKMAINMKRFAKYDKVNL